MLTDQDARLIAKYLCENLRKEILGLALQAKKEITQDLSDEILSFAQAAEYLKMPQNTLRKRLHDLPYHQEAPGCKIRFFKSELKHFMD